MPENTLFDLCIKQQDWIDFYTRMVREKDEDVKKGDIIVYKGSKIYFWDGEKVVVSDVCVDWADDKCPVVPKELAILQAPNYFKPNDWEKYEIIHTYINIVPYRQEILDGLKHEGDYFSSSFTVNGKKYNFYYDAINSTIEQVKVLLQTEDYHMVSSDYYRATIYIEAQ